MESKSNRAFEILDSARKAGRLHHAIILYGDSPSELERTAMDTASAIFGRDARSHPDLFVLRPEGKMRMIKIGSDKINGEYPQNSMRKLMEELRQSPNAGTSKVAVIYDADRMNVWTANAFLKTLEEPSGDTTIFLLTSRPNDLLDTIRSRCVSLRVEGEPEPIDDKDWREWLEDFTKWQREIMVGVKTSREASEFLMRCYALLSRFNSIISRLSEERSDAAVPEEKEVDEEIIQAEAAGERRRLRREMFAEIESKIVSCALGGEGVPAVKLSRAVESLERASGLTDLNMADTPALEIFMLESLRMWGR